MVAIGFEVQLVQTLLDALSGGTGALWEQHAEVMNEILPREQGKALMGNVFCHPAMCVLDFVSRACRTSVKRLYFYESAKAIGFSNTDSRTGFIGRRHSGPEF